MKQNLNIKIKNVPTELMTEMWEELIAAGLSRNLVIESSSNIELDFDRCVDIDLDQIGSLISTSVSLHCCSTGTKIISE